MIRSVFFSSALIVSTLSAGCAVTAANPAENDTSIADEALTGGKDANLKKLLAQVASDDRLEFRESDAIVAEVLRGGMTSSTLRTAVSFLMSPPKDLEKRPDGQVTADMGGLATLENMYFGMPRNLGGNGAGQSIVESTTETSTEFFFGETPKAPAEIRFVGTARKAYVLSFRMLEKPVSVAIPAGATAAQAATLLAAALNANAQGIIDSAQDPNVIDFQSDTYLTGLHADATGDTVKVSLDEDA